MSNVWSILQLLVALWPDDKYLETVMYERHALIKSQHTEMHVIERNGELVSKSHEGDEVLCDGTLSELMKAGRLYREDVRRPWWILEQSLFDMHVERGLYGNYDDMLRAAKGHAERYAEYILRISEAISLQSAYREAYGTMRVSALAATCSTAASFAWKMSGPIVEFSGYADDDGYIAVVDAQHNALIGKRGTIYIDKAFGAVEVFAFPHEMAARIWLDSYKTNAYRHPSYEWMQSF
jgi:hypothetical protein